MTERTQDLLMMIRKLDYRELVGTRKRNSCMMRASDPGQHRMMYLKTLRCYYRVHSTVSTCVCLPTARLVVVKPLQSKVLLTTRV